MKPLWIVDRSPRRRAALARLAAATEGTVLGAPGDPRFESAPVPEVVLLALDADWELELQFAHASGERAASARWILLGERGQEQAASELFDTRIAEFLAYPPAAHTLRARINAAPAARTAPALSERARRAAVSERFSRWFQDLELPDVLHALDPKLAGVPVLICGETGTGRGLLARYLHFFGGTGRGALAHLPCDETTRPADLAAALAAASSTGRGQPSLGIWLEGIERLPGATQRAVLSWLEIGPPQGAAGAPQVRWIATVREDALEVLDPELRLALGALSLRLPPLRERPNAIGRIAAETAREWCAERREPPRRFGEDALAVMEEYPWPGNVRELEALVVQSLASASRDPLHADDLQLDGVAFSPLDASVVGELLGDEDPHPPQRPDEGNPHRANPGHPGRLERGNPSRPQVEDGALKTLVAEPSDMEIDDLLEEISPLPEPDRGPAGAAPIALHAVAENSDGVLARLVTALDQEVRNPLATIRTFAELLPERFDDPEFRDRFTRMLSEDVGRIDGLVTRLASVANLSRPERDKVDVATLLEELLERRRQKIRAQRLLVLKELDTSEPFVLCDRAQLYFALDTLLGKALEWVPTHGDVYLASRHHPAGPTTGPSVRVLIRFHDPEGGGDTQRAAGVVEGSLELMISEIVVRAQGGTLSLASTDGEETVIVIDLPAPVV